MMSFASSFGVFRRRVYIADVLRNCHKKCDIAHFKDLGHLLDVFPVLSGKREANFIGIRTFIAADGRQLVNRT
jgi:hypothetical protein